MPKPKHPVCKYLVFVSYKLFILHTAYCYCNVSLSLSSSQQQQQQQRRDECGVACHIYYDYGRDVDVCILRTTNIISKICSSYSYQQMYYTLQNSGIISRCTRGYIIMTITINIIISTRQKMARAFAQGAHFSIVFTTNINFNMGLEKFGF